MALTYNNNVPQSSDNPSDSQSEFLTNFQNLKTIIEQNHTPFTDTTPGEHTVIVMPEEGGDPGGTANKGKLYTKDDGGVTQLYYQGSSGVVSQLSGAASGGAGGFVQIGPIYIQRGS